MDLDEWRAPVDASSDKLGMAIQRMWREVGWFWLERHMSDDEKATAAAIERRDEKDLDRRVTPPRRDVEERSHDPKWMSAREDVFDAHNRRLVEEALALDYDALRVPEIVCELVRRDPRFLGTHYVQQVVLFWKFSSVHGDKETIPRPLGWPPPFPASSRGRASWRMINATAAQQHLHKLSLAVAATSEKNSRNWIDPRRVLDEYETVRDLLADVAAQVRAQAVRARERRQPPSVAPYLEQVLREVEDWYDADEPDDIRAGLSEDGDSRKLSALVESLANGDQPSEVARKFVGSRWGVAATTLKTLLLKARKMRGASTSYRNATSRVSR